MSNPSSRHAPCSPPGQMSSRLLSSVLFALLAGCPRPPGAPLTASVRGAGPAATTPVQADLACGPTQPDVPTCPRGWGACWVSAPGQPPRLWQPGRRSPLAKVEWHDADGDGVRDAEQRVEYDARGNVTRVWIDSNGNGVPEVEGRARYDGRGLLIERWELRRFAGSGPQRGSYAYHAGGDLLASNEAIGAATPREQRYEYDAQGRLLRRGDSRYEYSPRGPLIRESTSTWSRQFEHDAIGLVVREWTTTGYEARTQRDAAGRPVEVVITDGPGATPTIWRTSYDASGQVTRAWGERAGKLVSDRRSRYDGEGRLVEQWDDHDGDGTANKVEHTEYTSGGLVARRWYDVNGDGTPDGDTRFEYDAAGHRTRQLEAAMGGSTRPSSDLRWTYDRDRLVRTWDEATPGYGEELRYDDDGNLIELIQRGGGVTASIHFEVDRAAVAALRAVAPSSCLGEAPPTPVPARRPVVDHPQGLYASYLQLAPRAPAVLTLPPVPRPERDGKVAAEPGLRLWQTYRAHLRALTDAALRARGWRRAPLHQVDPSVDPALMGGVRVARGSQSCGPGPDYVFDDKGQVFMLQVVPACGRTQRVDFRGEVPYEGGCGVEPPPQDVYAEAPPGARLVTKGPALTVNVPLCLDLRPEGVGAPPP